MSIQEMITARMITATKAKDAIDRNVYRLLKGKLDLMHEQPVTDRNAVAMFRKFLGDAKTYPQNFSEREVEILTELVPRDLDEAETLSFLQTNLDLVEQIRSCPKEGQAMGIAMKAFNVAGKDVKSENVRSAIAILKS